MTPTDLDIDDDGHPKPRPAGPQADPDATMRSSVAGHSSSAGLWLVGGGALLLGLVAFLWLTSHRPQSIHGLASNPSDFDSAAAVAASAAPPPEVGAMEAAARAGPPPPPPPPVATVAPPPPAIQSAPPPPLPVQPAHPVPALVIDFGGDDEGAPKPAPKAAGAGAAAGREAGTNPMNGDEQFAARIESSEPARSRATMLRNKGAIVSQGAMIPAVLETALNSDLPGFTRAVVSRDVRSFDGSQVLIPRGSRVIGQYRSAAALGQSRAFVIWTRVLRPDGASIQIGSSGADQLGRAGLDGKVDRHFFERFSGGILLSVIDVGAAALVGQPSTQVVIGSSQDASSLAATASALAPTNIPPTIKVAQGTPIRIFVARDLDFTSVGGNGE